MIVKKKLQKITPQTAERLLKFNTFEGQRNMSEKIVQEYAEKMEDGKFHTGSVALVHGEFGTRLVDGQKQLQACILSKKSFDAVVQDFNLNGEARSHEVVCADIFSQFGGGQIRTALQIAWMYGCQLGWAEWQKAFVGSLASALSALASGEFSVQSAHELPKDKRGFLLTEHTQVCAWLQDMGAATNRHISRSPILAAMILSWRTSQRAATEFWSGVRDGEGLTKSDPRYTLREYLKTVRIRGGMGTRDKDSPRGIHVKCAHAWNAWRQGKTTSLKYHADAPIPKFR